MSMHPPITAVRDVVSRALTEDVEPLGDLTSALLDPEAAGRATFVARSDGVVAGRLAVEETFRQVDPDTDLGWRVDDGGEVRPGEQVAEVSGSLRSLLTAERTALNLLCHLSGVATLTRRYVRAAGGGARILDTRKTTPGLRALEKAAVRAGGGFNHRGNLSDWILLKDNHVAVLGITEAVRRARLRWPGRTVEVEVDRFSQLQEAIAAGVDIVLLDNMSPEEVRQCVDERGPAPTPLIEVSGGVALRDVGDYARAGADLISVGALTHSAPVLDIGLDLSEGD